MTKFVFGALAVGAWVLGILMNSKHKLYCLLIPDTKLRRSLHHGSITKRQQCSFSSDLKIDPANLVLKQG